jgi:hypothetical protein
VTTSTIVDTWKSTGHKVANDDDNDTENIVANQPGAGQESTGDNENDEAEDFILYQVSWTCQKRSDSRRAISIMVSALLLYKHVYIH